LNNRVHREASIQGTLLAETWARLSDVFGSDNILWVEGRTEEMCYKKIHRYFYSEDLSWKLASWGYGTPATLKVMLPERMLEIYNKHFNKRRHGSACRGIHI